MTRFYLPSGETIEGLRQARKTGAYPSVTSVLDSFTPYGLVIYKSQQLAMSALTLPREKDESETDWWKRVAKDAEEHSRKAAAWGTRLAEIVRDCNLMMAGMGVFDGSTVEPEYKPAFDSYVKWYQSTVGGTIHVEQVLINKTDGYAGRCDLCYVDMDKKICMLDIKTQDTKGKGKFNFYKKYPLQLSAYSIACGIKVDRLESLMISSTEPGLLEVHVWEMPVDYYFDKFLSLLNYWKYENNYMRVLTK